MNLRTILDRGDNYKYLNGVVKLDEFEEKDSSHPFYEEWLKKTTCLEFFCYILKILYAVIILSQLF